MSVTKQIAKIILSEHARAPIRGTMLMSGRQTVVPSVEEIRAYLKEFNIPERPVEFDIDKDTLGATGKSITDKNFFELFTDATYNSLDVTDYENAEIIHDMNYPVPDSLKGKFDFIYDGGAMDNLFNPAQYIMNVSEMLAPGGRILHCNLGSLWRGAYLMYSADFFHDFYALNNYENCYVYYGRFKWSMLMEPWKVTKIKPFKDPGMQQHRRSWVSSIWPHVVFVIAEKGEASTSQKMPIQLTYRPKDEDWDVYLSSYRRFAENPRVPATFGRPTRHAFNLRERVRSFIKRPFPFTRSNTRPVQKL